MSREEEKTPPRSRLWSSDEREQRPPQRQPEEKVVPLPRIGIPSDRVYTAFEVRPNVSRLHIHAATQPSRFPSYNYLLDMVFDHDFQSTLILVYSFMAVELKGQNLGEIVHAINAGSCAVIREYHRKWYDAPAKGQTVIEAVKFTLAGDEK